MINWKPFAVAFNTEGDNCGTGAGGFQPGNTCGSKKGASSAVSRLVDYDAYSSHDSWWEPDGKGGRIDRTKPPSMGGLPPAYRTPEMNAVLKDSKTIIGRQPEFFNVSKRAVGLKYTLRPNESLDKFQVFRDTLLDREFEVKLVRSDNYAILDKQLETRTARYMQDAFPNAPHDDVWEMRAESYRQRLETQYRQSNLYKNYITITIS